MGRTWVRILDFAMLYVMLALGLNIVVGFAGLLDLGYVAFYAVGAYFYAILASPQFGIHLPFWALLPTGAGIACLFGVLLGAPTLRLRGDYLAIVTLGFGEIIRIFLNNLNAPVNVTNGPQGINMIDPVTHRRPGPDAPHRPLRDPDLRGPRPLLPVPGPDPVGDLHRLPPPGIAHRARLGRHPRGRGGRRGHGHQHPQHQAPGLRHGGHLRRPGGRALRRLPGVREPRSPSP